ncbi:MAG: type pilus assembly protein PilM [Actinomycetota bacterium]|nr:type pilus assembly protein PilM [Cryptosporangiaceae bacterium]MDQ1677569.1 type pilus assembly protein PilM [Actinomycetota bacterium]
MARRTAVGLDIGTSGVRAAEVTHGKDHVTLERFGQVALPVGAVVDGEVVDVDAVAAALRRLWAATRFRTKKVALGVANQRVIVRQVDLPWLPPAELKASLPFQVQDFIPMPVDQVLLDYHPLEEITTETGGRAVRALLVAASKEMVWRSVDAVRKAGLQPVMVDLVPFAVLRSIAQFDHLGLESGEAEAVVNVGASVTNLIVHTGGVPRFVRIIPMGGADITDALAERLGVTLDEAEAIKQVTGFAEQHADGRDMAPAAKVIEATATTFVDEVRTSLEYYKTQAAAYPIGRIVLTGGGTRLAGLADRLALATRLRVQDGSVLSTVRLGKLGLDHDQLAYVDPLASVPVGLAMGVAS